MARVRLAASTVAFLVAACDQDPTLAPLRRSLQGSPAAMVATAATSSATVTPLGGVAGYDSHIAQAVNASGRSVGIALGGAPPAGYPSTLAEAFNPNAEVFIAFPVPGGAPVAATDALSINDGGVIGGLGVLDSRFRVFAGGGNWLPQLPDGVNQFGGYVNNAAEVVGWTSFDVNNTTPGHATLWLSGGGGSYSATDLGLFGDQTIEPRALAPNLSGNSRIIVGRYVASTFNGYTALIWQGGSWSELPGPAGCFRNYTSANDVSDDGIVVGGEFFCGNGPAIWQNGVFRSLLPECQLAYGSTGSGGEARGIAVTTAGRIIIVGTCIDQPAVWYDDGQGGFICELLPLLTGDTSGDAYDVNASGQIVGRSAGSVSHAVQWNFTIPPAGGRPPNAVPGGSYSGDEGTAIAFNGSGSSDPDDDPLAYDWDFGDGSPHGTGATPSHTYVDNGTYTVTLTVSDGTGNSDVATTSAAIVNAAPLVFAGSATTVQSGDVLNFNGSFSDVGVGDAPWATSITWGDGTAATLGNTNTQGVVTASHAYYATGSFTLQLAVTDKDLGAGTAARAVMVSPRAVAFTVAPNPISLSGKKAMQIELAVLATPEFDASLIDPASVRVGDGSDPDAVTPLKKNGTYAFSTRDVNRDGLRDFTFSINKSDPNLGLSTPSTNLVLRALAPTTDGTIAIRSTATVNVVP